MRRFVTLPLSSLIAASLLLGSASVTAARSVDPSTLQPPPPADARCHSAGNQVICDTVLNSFPVNEAAFDAECGTLYFTGTDLRNGFRFYTDGKMTRRHVTAHLDGVLTLSPTGAGPYLRMTGRLNWWAYWPVPGTADDGIQTNHGIDIRISGPGIGAGFMIAGNFQPDGTTHGIFTAFSDESFDLLCAALGG